LKTSERLFSCTFIFIFKNLVFLHVYEVYVRQTITQQHSTQNRSGFWLKFCRAVPYTITATGPLRMANPGREGIVSRQVGGSTCPLPQEVKPKTYGNTAVTVLPPNSLNFPSFRVDTEWL